MGNDVPDQPRFRSLVPVILEHCSSVEDLLAAGSSGLPNQLQQSVAVLLQVAFRAG
jgi:hypothetical protein